MKNQIFHAISIEEAAAASKARPFLPYNPDPAISKLPENRPLRPVAPLQVFDNVWWLGSQTVGVLVIDTGEGYIMIDAASNEQEAAYIAQSFAQMHLDSSKIRLIVISHEHFDHYGGVPYFKKNICPGAYVAMSRTGWNLLQTVPTEFAFTAPRVEHADILMDDGLCLKLGNTELLCIATPGHSAGCFSFIFNSVLHGKELSVGVMGGSAVWPNFPEARLYENSVEYFRLFTDLEQCSAFSAVHQSPAQLDRVRDHWNKGTPHPWVCAKEDYDEAYLQGFRNKVRKTVYSGFIQPYLMPDGKPEGSPLPPETEE